MGISWKKAKKALNPKEAVKFWDPDIYDPGNLFTAPDLPDPTPAPLAPTMADPAVAEAQRKEREVALRRGRQSTIATSGQGDLSTPHLARRKLLGA